MVETDNQGRLKTNPFFFMKKESLGVTQRKNKFEVIPKENKFQEKNKNDFYWRN